MGEQIGEIFDKRTEVTVEWRIPDFLSLPRENLKMYWRGMTFADFYWELGLFPNGWTMDSEGWIGILLNKWEDRPKAVTVGFTLGVRMEDGTEEIKVQRDRHTFSAASSCFGAVKFLKRTDLLDRRAVLAPLGALTITCTIKLGGLNTVNEKCISTGVTLFQKHMKELLATEKDADIRISVSNKEFPAHRCILKARSPVFDKMLTHDTTENNSGVINIVDCDADAFEEFLRYIYSGRVESLTASKALNLFYIADKYDFSELMEECISFLKNTSLSNSSVCDVILFAKTREQGELLEVATNFFLQNINEILITVEWQNFLHAHPMEANELFIAYSSQNKHF